MEQKKTEERREKREQRKEYREPELRSLGQLKGITAGVGTPPELVCT
jgi:hypothetical protein